MKLTAKKQAFSMIEILIVVMIIGALAVMVGRGIRRRLEKIKVNQTKTTIASIKGSLLEYYTEKGGYPKSLDEIASYFDKGIIPKDEWGNEFEYNKPPVRYKNEYKKYEIYSLGPDEEESEDDIHNGA